MAQPNVAREPSMEEILASIRRIIESNDPTSDAAALHDASSSYADDEIEDFDEGSFVPDMVANDPGLPRAPEPVAATAVVSAPAEKSMSLADVAARVRAASARHQDMATSRSTTRDEDAGLPPLQPSAAEVDFAKPTPFRETSASIVSLPMPELRPALVEPLQSVPAVLPEPVSVATEPAAAVEMTAEEPVSAPVPAVVSPEPVAEPTVSADLSSAPVSAPAITSMSAMAGLLSEAAGAQVAKSFGELAEVFDGLERRSVEDMAQEMLRPMLQEWLDDNLPTLVERLVREEIERVARGPRR
ncbi:DUF2497 domain-containing protein [Neorhizobium sp. NCHU2750]|uniref:DUF2497 domain-containing protein n=1 Tax=Neorhizobium sp. NCHU2750 TaxID=1825976 RepID=UPI000E725DF0|nr:hypothetical protein NCHU2750_21560 [Neorhizobium sp. NCHU2750]